MNELLDLQEYLTNNFPGSYVMPIKSAKDKSPKYFHKNNVWSHDQAMQSIKKRECENGALIILSKDLIVIDVDDYEWVENLEEMFPSFKNTVICRTKKGKHYYFRRTNDASIISDGARKMVDIPIDFKTVCSTGTGGIIVIPPSPGKSWIKPFGPNDPIPIPKDFLSFVKERVKKQTKPNKKTIENSVEPNEHLINDVKNLVGLLSSSRANARDSWIRVGWCLHNISPTPTFLEIWTEWSKQSTKFKKGECDYEWSQCIDKGLNIGSLHMWAKHDSPLQYAEFVSKTMASLDSLIQLCCGAHRSVAAIAYYLLQNKYVCSDSNGKWYKFNGTLWVEDGNMIYLGTDLSTIVRDHYLNAMSKLSDHLFNTMDKQSDSIQSSASTKVPKNETLTTLSKTIKNLQDRHFKDNVMHQMKEYFFDPDFFKKLDSNPNLIAFTNGVWELNEHKFRKAVPEDYLSISTKYDYISIPNIIYQQKVLNYWNTLHPIVDQREYTIKTLARQLQGDVGNNLFHIHAGQYGSAANGKSTCFETLERCLGDYMRKFSIELLVSKKRLDPSKPNPEMEYWKGRRILYSTEPNCDEVLNSGVMKELTGGENMTYRMLNSNDMRVFSPMYKMHIMTNNAPKIDGGDSGVKRRIRKIDYISQFVPKEQVNEENNMYQRDDNFISELRNNNEYKMEFIRHLLDHYDHTFQFEMPQVIADNSQEYIEDNDNVFKFVQEQIVKKKDGYFTLKEAKVAFKVSEHWNGKIQTLKNDLIKCLNTPCLEQKKINGKKEVFVFEGYIITHGCNEEEIDLLD